MGWLHDRQVSIAGRSMRAHVHMAGDVADRLEMVSDPAEDIAVLHAALHFNARRYRVAALTRRREVVELRLEPAETAPVAPGDEWDGKSVAQ